MSRKISVLGARFYPGLELPDSVIKVIKGVCLDHDQYWPFDRTGLGIYLRKQDIHRLFVGGLAEDVCVLATVLDARKEGFEVVLIQDATRPVTPQGGEKARKEMQVAGVHIL